MKGNLIFSDRQSHEEENFSLHAQPSSHNNQEIGLKNLLTLHQYLPLQLNQLCLQV